MSDDLLLSQRLHRIVSAICCAGSCGSMEDGFCACDELWNLKAEAERAELAAKPQRP